MNYQFVSTLPTPVLLIYLPSVRILHLNPAGQEEWGYQASAVEKLHLNELLAPADEESDEAFARFLAGHDGLVVRLTADVATADKRRRRYQFVARAGVEEEPDVGLLAAIDVSEQDALFRALEEDARRLRALVESNFDAYYDWHISGGYHEWSTQMDTMLGMPAGSLPTTLDAWVQRLHPDQRDAVLARLQESVDTRSSYQDEYLLRREDGEYRCVTDRGVLLFDEQNRPSQLVGVIRDVTEKRASEAALQQSEELYRTLFQATPNPALRTDDVGRCIEANQAACEFLRLTHSRLLRTHISDHFGEPAEHVLTSLSQTDASSREAVTVELKVGEDEDERTLVTSVIPGPVGDRLTYFWLGTDVTSLRRLNAALEQSQTSLETQMKAREEYSVALKVILEQGRQERLEMQRAIRDNVDRLVAPMFDRLDRVLSGRPEAAYLDAVRQTLTEIANMAGASSERAPDPMQGPLTRRELEVARLVRIGKSSDEIAEILHVSPATVSYHRKKIRAKFGLTGKAARLSSYLLEPTEDTVTETGDNPPAERPRAARSRVKGA